jgi:hypothetical protein
VVVVKGFVFVVVVGFVVVVFVVVPPKFFREPTFAQFSQKIGLTL